MIFKPTGKGRRRISTISVPGATATRDATAARDATDVADAVEADVAGGDAVVEAGAKQETTRAVGNPQPKRISFVA